VIPETPEELIALFQSNKSDRERIDLSLADLDSLQEKLKVGHMTTVVEEDGHNIVVLQFMFGESQLVGCQIRYSADIDLITDTTLLHAVITNGWLGQMVQNVYAAEVLRMMQEGVVTEEMLTAANPNIDQMDAQVRTDLGIPFSQEGLFE
jgi:hypothetical protein